MPRIRTVKPEFWSSGQVVDCSIEARLMFIGIWNYCDDNGIHSDSPKRIKMQVFPGDDMSIEQVSGWLDELELNGLIKRYEVDGSRYLMCTGFKKHQRIDQPTYTHPLPDGTKPKQPGRRRSNDDVRRTEDERSANNGRTFAGCSVGERKGEESKGTIPLPEECNTGDYIENMKITEF